MSHHDNGTDLRRSPLRRGGIWNMAQTPRKNFFSEFSNFSVVFERPPLRSVMFAVNTTTRAASNLDYLQFCLSQPLLSPGTVHQKFEWVLVKNHNFSKHLFFLRSNTVVANQPSGSCRGVNSKHHAVGEVWFGIWFSNATEKCENSLKFLKFSIFSMVFEPNSKSHLSAAWCLL